MYLQVTTFIISIASLLPPLNTGGASLSKKFIAPGAVGPWALKDTCDSSNFVGHDRLNDEVTDLYWQGRYPPPLVQDVSCFPAWHSAWRTLSCHRASPA